MRSTSFQQRVILRGLIVPLAIFFSPLVAGASPTARITGLSTIHFGTWDGINDLEQHDDICIYNSAGADYNIVITGTGGSFNMTNAGHNLAYEVKFSVSGVPFSMAHGVGHDFTGANSTADDCSAGTGGAAQIQVIVRQTALAAALSGSYGGSFDILLTPAP